MYGYYIHFDIDKIAHILMTAQRHTSLQGDYWIIQWLGMSADYWYISHLNYDCWQTKCLVRNHLIEVALQYDLSNIKQAFTLILLLLSSIRVLFFSPTLLSMPGLCFIKQLEISFISNRFCKQFNTMLPLLIALSWWLVYYIRSLVIELSEMKQTKRTAKVFFLACCLSHFTYCKH